ncbi:hypothetical protein FWF48_00240 [Candidatus Saccharibacteria bacterium]|nr:hypothetical protein [Candidatus Saccharibacteria bacterium]
MSEKLPNSDEVLAAHQPEQLTEQQTQILGAKLVEINRTLDTLPTITTEGMPEVDDGHVLSLKSAEVDKPTGGIFIKSEKSDTVADSYVNTEQATDALGQLDEETVNGAQIYQAMQEAQQGSRLELDNLAAISNQDARTVDAFLGQERIGGGAQMLGNEQIELENGEWLSRDEITAALEKLLVDDGNSGEVAPTPQDGGETLESAKKITKREKLDKFKKAAAVIGATVATALLISVPAIAQAPGYHQTPEPTPAITYTVETPTAETVNDRLTGPRIGDINQLKEGTEYTIASDRSDVSGEIGNKYRQPGEYTVDRAAFLNSEGKIIGTTHQPGEDIEQAKTAIENETGQKVDKTEIHYNQGESLEHNKPTGWVGYNQSNYESIGNVMDGK